MTDEEWIAFNNRMRNYNAREVILMRIFYAIAFVCFILGIITVLS